MLYLAILMMMFNSHTPSKQFGIGFLNADRTTVIDTQDAWTDVDGLTDVGFPQDAGFTACRGTKGISPQYTDNYEIRVYANYTKVSGANNVSFDFGITADGAPLPAYQTTVVSAPGRYLSNNSHVTFPLQGGVCYGVAVRNTTNTDDITFRSYYLILERVN